MPTVTTPSTKAPTWIIRLPQPNRIAAAAPTQAPEETPSRSGETMGFLKMLW